MSVVDTPNVRDRAQTGFWVLSGQVVRAALAAGGLAVLLAALYGRIMSYGLRRDEMMFVPPAELLPELRLYDDFFFNHVPNSAWYYFGILGLLGDGGLLFAARTGVFLAWVLLVCVTGWTTWRISHSRAVTLFSVLALLTADPLLSQAGMAATNNLLPLPLIVLGLGLFVSETMQTRPGALGLFVAGACLALAAGTKVSSVVFIPPVAVGAFLLPAAMPFGLRLIRVALLVALGGMIGALPLFWYLVSDPQVFLAHVLEFHTGPHVTYWQVNAALEPGLAMTSAGKLALAYQTWLSGVPLITFFALAYSAWIVLRDTSRGDVREEAYLGQIMVVLAALALTVPMSLLPTPGFPQYYILPLACAPILIALFHRRLRSRSRTETLPFFGTGMLAMLLLALPRLAPGLAALDDRSAFTPARTAQVGAEIARILAQNVPQGGAVVTFMPIYPLEAGLPVLPELATGQFAYRIAPYTDRELAASYRMAGEGELVEGFDGAPPAAFLLGFEPRLEAPFLRFAQENAYREIPVAGLENRYGEGRLFVRNDGGGQ